MARLFVALMSLAVLIASIEAMESPSSNIVSNNNSMCVVSALFRLDNVMDLSQLIKEESERKCIIHCIAELQIELETAYHTGDFENVKDSCMYFSENVHEILSECLDRELCDKIILCICSMIKEIE